MRCIISLCITTWVTLSLLGIANAQEQIFPLDQAGNILYYEVIDAKQQSIDALSTNCKAYLMAFHNLSEKKIKKLIEKKKSFIEFDSTAHTYLSKGSYVVYPGKFLKHATGEINYELVVEIKENKYRYYFNKFVYIPYALNRYGKYAPVSGKAVLFNSFALSNELLKEQEQAKFAAYMEGQVFSLKQAMQQTITAAKEDKQEVIKIIAKDW